MDSPGNRASLSMGTFTGDPEGNVKKRLWKRAFLTIGEPLGNLKGVTFTGDFERRTKDGSRDM